MFAQKRYAEAEPLLLTGYDTMKKHPGEPGLEFEAAHRLHDFYPAWNRPADAARFASSGTDSPVPSPSP